MPRHPFRTLAAMVLGILAVLGVAGPAAAAKPAPPKAMWIWQQAPVEDVVGWATAHGVRDLFVTFPGATNGTPDLTWYRALRTRADRAKLTMAALGGDPTWATNPAAATRWAESARRTGLFSGLHVDVEPYALPAWNTDQATVVRGYLQMLTQLRAQPLPVEYDVPFWYSTIAVASGGNLADAVLARASRLIVLTYRNTVTGPNSLLEVGRDMLTRAKPGTAIRLAIETQPLASCPYCTFFGARQSAVNAALTDIDRLAGGYPVYAGVAVHHYQTWRALRP
jgi:hypothetical protein